MGKPGGRSDGDRWRMTVAEARELLRLCSASFPPPGGRHQGSAGKGSRSGLLKPPLSGSCRAWAGQANPHKVDKILPFVADFVCFTRPARTTSPQNALERVERTVQTSLRI